MRFTMLRSPRPARSGDRSRAEPQSRPCGLVLVVRSENPSRFELEVAHPCRAAYKGSSNNDS